MPQIGDRVTASIRLVRELGSGGMGSVWIADHEALQTQVVVKFMHASLADDKESLLRFSREAAAAANVKSPHVVQVLDYGLAADGAPFIVMELLEGCDLATHRARVGAMRPAEVDLVIAQICKALERAHERGIIHRDIKPQNIFLTTVRPGEIFVKVLDFGIAKTRELQQGAGVTTRSGTVMGSPQYMSPEQMVGAKGVDHRTDLWAVGVVAFECLTGRRAFEADTLGGLAVAICSTALPVPSRVNPALTQQVDEWFARACAREAADRFDSANEMADTLHRVLSGLTGNRRISVSPSGVSGSPFDSTSNVADLAGPSSDPHPAAAAPGAPHVAGSTTRSPVSSAVGGATPTSIPRHVWAGVGVAVALVSALALLASRGGRPVSSERALAPAPSVTASVTASAPADWRQVPAVTPAAPRLSDADAAAAATGGASPVTPTARPTVVAPSARSPAPAAPVTRAPGTRGPSAGAKAPRPPASSSVDNDLIE